MAVTVQVPTAIPETVLPRTVQILGVVLLKLTARPEVALAETVPLPPKVIVGAEPKLTVWPVFGVTVLLETDAAPVPKLLVAVTVKV